MLFKINSVLGGLPAKIINFLTFGTKGASACARAYLYQRYISKNNVLVNCFVWLVDGIEAKHCYLAARSWRRRFINNDCRLPKGKPKEYYKFFRS